MTESCMPSPSVTAATRTSTAIRFPADVHAALTEAAAERDLSMNFLVVRAVRDYLPRLLPMDEIVWTREVEPTPPDEAYRAGGEAAMRMVENLRCVECGKEFDPLGMRPPNFEYGGNQ